MLISFTLSKIIYVINTRMYVSGLLNKCENFTSYFHANAEKLQNNTRAPFYSAAAGFNFSPDKVLHVIDGMVSKIV